MRPSTLVASSLLVLAAILQAGCNSSAPTIDCSTTDPKPFKELSSAFGYCTSCHGANRADAGIRYDNYQSAVDAADGAERTISEGSMPPDTDMPEAEAESVYAWVQCGTPE